MASSLRSAILYVRADAAGPETNGLSWSTAFSTIPDALQHAASGDEVWVAAGNYRGPVQVPTGVALYGGFAGDETHRTQRDWSRHKSVIDWQQWGDGLELFNEQFGPVVFLRSGSRLDGFTVMNGWHSHGSGAYATESGAIIANNIVVNNRAMGILPSAVLVDRPGHFDVGDDFFLKTANDLLHLQFPFGVTNIPVAQYTPAVHRLLQIAANIYDAVRSNTFPSVFRPLFDGPIITGYYEDNSAANVAQWLATSNAYGIPMIIGARRGFPNFNEFDLEMIVSAARRLEMRRLTTNSPPTQTNEMYILGLENRVGVEAWNSYTNRYSDQLDVAIANKVAISIANNDGLLFSTNYVFSVLTNYAMWPGFVSPNPLSFKIPLLTNTVLLSNGVYRTGPPEGIEPSGNIYDYVPNSGFHVPEWTLTVSNSLIFMINSGGKIVDFVHLILTNSFGLATNFFNVNAGQTLSEGPIGLCWSTNRHGSSIYAPTAGIDEQIDISLGQVQVSQSQWATFNSTPASNMQAAITNFRQFVFPNIFGVSNTNLMQVAPFSPVRKLVISTKWEANDPLVHALLEHLKPVTNNYTQFFVKPFVSVPLTNSSLGVMNSRYRPWGGRPGSARTFDDVDRRLKDSGLWSANEFNFPSGSEVNIDWLDRIHRGTPWQTLYFDRDAAPMDVWIRQPLDPATHPTNDWKIIEYLRGQLAYSGSPTPTRVVNNTIVGNDAGLWIATNASASVMNNAVVYNSAGIVDEGGASVQLSANCVSCSPQFLTDFSVVATSPLIDAGDADALAWTDRPVFGSAVDIGAMEFGPDGVPVLTFQRTSPTEYELALRGFSGQSYVVEASTNLLSWTAISTNTAVMGSILMQDAAGTNYSHRFYRAKVANHPN